MKGSEGKGSRSRRTVDGGRPRKTIRTTVDFESYRSSVEK